MSACCDVVIARDMSIRRAGRSCQAFCSVTAAASEKRTISLFDRDLKLSTSPHYSYHFSPPWLSYRRPDMFSASAGRVIRSACCPHASSPLSAFVPAASIATLPRASFKTHQRRLSSSKTSRDSDGLKGALPSQSTASSPSRVSRTKQKPTVLAPEQSPFSNLPSVPKTTHLHPAGIEFYKTMALNEH